MEKQIKYVQLSADNAENCKVFESLMYEYINEMNEHSERPLPKEFHQKWINSIIAMQGPSDRHLELCYVKEIPIGIWMNRLGERNNFVVYHRGVVGDYTERVIEIWIPIEKK